MNDSWRRLHDAARRDDPYQALVTLHRSTGGDVLRCGPGGHSIAPEEIVRRATRVRVGGSDVDRATQTEEVCTPAQLERLGLVALRHGGACASEPDQEWTTALAWSRLGMSERLLNACMTSLDGRWFGGSKLLHQQLVKGALADVAAELTETRTLLTGTSPDRSVVALVHRQLTGADRTQLRLLGANGFAADGPGRWAYVSELLADVYAGSDAGKATKEPGAAT
ncbi:hypothetical protein [Streptomyces europaeiscabiei]|uniref:hypothetical protein n=1 Tax=Streptomyces europaeiscabiei TaxID=146819 RepID=UPI0029BBF399|nr:hypothetical protein [Streptomyces europaeiscabiei]MDX2525306.1 hypothetical protein [Streptomyces europaeiscabiei]